MKEEAMSRREWKCSIENESWSKEGHCVIIRLSDGRRIYYENGVWSIEEVRPRIGISSDEVRGLIDEDIFLKLNL